MPSMPPTPSMPATDEQALCSATANLAHNRYHRAARGSAGMAIIYAALAGKELISQRKKIKHGQWDAWIAQNCEFDRATAWRYMQLYEQIQGKFFKCCTLQHLKQEACQNDEANALRALIVKHPSQLSQSETDEMLAILRQAADRNSLRQLYFDLGIVTPPLPVGGANSLNHWLAQNGHADLAGTPLIKLPDDVREAWRDFCHKNTAAHHELQAGITRDAYKRILGELCNEILIKKSYGRLPRRQLEEIYEMLLECKNEIGSVLKQQK